jgi:lysophospholipase L1-like esterase
VIAGRVALALSGLVLGLCAAEIGLRVVGYEGEHERLATVFDDDLGQIRADSWVHDAVFDPHRSDHVNVNGQKVTFEKSAGRTRIVFLGDSATWGAGVEPAEAYPVVFRDLEEERDDGNLEVLNAAVIGMTTVGEYRLLADRVLTLDPDVVVLGLFMANDINWNLGNEHLLDASPSVWIRLWGRLRKHSALIHFAHLRLLAFSAESGAFGGYGGAQPRSSVLGLDLIDDRGMHMLDYFGGEIATYERRYSATMEHAFTLLKELLFRFNTLAESSGFQFVVLVIPTASQIDDELMMFRWPDPWGTVQRRGYDVSEEDLDFQKPLHLVREICEETRVLCVDPTEDLRRLGATRVVLPADDHPSREGHRVLAETLAGHFDSQQGRFADREPLLITDY